MITLLTVALFLALIGLATSLIIFYKLIAKKDSHINLYDRDFKGNNELNY